MKPVVEACKKTFAINMLGNCESGRALLHGNGGRTLFQQSAVGDEAPGDSRKPRCARFVNRWVRGAAPGREKRESRERGATWSDAHASTQVLRRLEPTRARGGRALHAATQPARYKRVLTLTPPLAGTAQMKLFISQSCRNM